MFDFRVLVLGPTRAEGCGIAEYMRQVFSGSRSVEIRPLNWFNCLICPLSRPTVFHVQFEFFLFDRFIGVSGLLFYLWLWLWSRVLRYKVVTTVHSTYNVTTLREHFPQFQRWSWAYSPAKAYLLLYYRVIAFVSHRIIALTPAGAKNLADAGCRGAVVFKLCGYNRDIAPKDHGLLTIENAFVCFGFAFPNKGFDVAIHASAELQRRGRNLRLFIVSGRTAKPGIPGGGASGYLSILRSLSREIGAPVDFVGYLDKTDPLLEELAFKATAFLFPYRERDVTSGALNTVLSFGRPIIVSSAKCFDEYPELPRFTGGDSLMLAHEMQQLMDSESAIECAQQNVRALWERGLKSPMADEHLSLYRALNPRGEKENPAWAPPISSHAKGIG